MGEEMKSLASFRHGAVVVYANSTYTKMTVDYCYYDGDGRASVEYDLISSAYEQVLAKASSFAGIMPLDEDYHCSFYAKLGAIDHEHKIITYQTYSFIDDENPWEISGTDKIFKVESQEECVNAYLILGEDYSFFIEF